MFIVNPSRFITAGGGGGGSDAATVSYVGRYRSTTAGTTHTITADNIGSAEHVLVVFYRQADPAITSTMTVGGDSATNLFPSRLAYSSWYIVAAPVDTTPNIVVTFSSSVNAVGMAVYGLTNLESTTPTDSDSSTAVNNTLTVDTDAEGVVVYSSFGNDGPVFTTGSKHFEHEWYPDDGAEHIGWSQVATGASYSRATNIGGAPIVGTSLVSFR